MLEPHQLKRIDETDKYVGPVGLILMYYLNYCHNVASVIGDIDVTCDLHLV